MQVRTISPHAFPDARTLCLRAIATRIALTWAEALGPSVALEVARNVVQALAWLGAEITPAVAVREALEHRRKHLGQRHVTEAMIVHFSFTAAVIWEQSAHGRSEAFATEQHPLLKLGSAGELDVEARLRRWGEAAPYRRLSTVLRHGRWEAVAWRDDPSANAVSVVMTGVGDSPDAAQAALADMLDTERAA